MVKPKLNDCCQKMKDKYQYVKEGYNTLTPKQKIIADVSVGAAVGLGVGIILGLLLNKKRE